MNGQQELDWLFPDKPEIADLIHKVGDDTVVVEPLSEVQERLLPKAPLSKHVPFGTYTVVIYDDDKPHRTVRVRPWGDDRQGVSVFEMLTGPDNSLDFSSFGEQRGDGPFRIWKKHGFRTAWLNAAKALVALAAGDEEGLEESGLKYHMMSERCRKCNRKLTVPESVMRGMGPECAS